MRLHSICLTAALIALSTLSASAGINLSDYNLIASGSVTDSADVDGRVLVGGTVHTNNFNFGQALPADTASSPPSVFGTLASGVNTINNHGHAFLFGSGSPVKDGNNNTVTANSSAAAPYLNGLATYLSNLSTAYASMATNSTVTATDRNQISFVATPTTINGNSVAVFSVDQSFFTSNGTVTSVSGFNSNTTVVINVTGGTPGNDPLNFASFSPFQNVAYQANIIFNFENATSLIGVNNLGGSILAPNADLNTGNALVGSVYVKSVSNSGEIDLAKNGGAGSPGFTGYVPSVNGVPEPASIASTLAGLAMVGAGAWRRRRRTA